MNNIILFHVFQTSGSVCGTCSSGSPMQLQVQLSSECMHY